MVKKAFTLIELIFAIVVLSIAFLAMPQLFESSTSQIEEIAKDEATFYGFKAIQNVYRYYWDDKSESKGMSYILDVTNGDSELARLPGTVVGKGQASFGTQANNRRFYTNVVQASSTLGAEESSSSDYDDIDDFNNKSESTQSTIVDITSTINVFYLNDNANYSANTLNLTITPTPAAASTNIKMIQVSVTDTSSNPLIIYRTFACNIGARKIEFKELK